MTNFCTIIVPIGESDGNLRELKSWIPTALTHGCEVVLIHDYKSEKLRKELEQTLKLIGDTKKVVNIYGAFGSPGGARNAGLEVVKSRWVAFWDSDDEPNVDNFVKMLRDAENGDFSVACGSFVQTNRNNSQSSLILNSPTNLNAALTYPGLWRFAFHVEVVKSIKFDLLNMGEDLNFLAKLGLERRKIFFSSNIVYKYFTGGQFQLTSKGDRKEKLCKTIEILQEIVLSQPRDSFASKLLLKLFLSKLSLRKVSTSLKPWSAISVLVRKMSMSVFIQSVFELMFTKRWSTR